MEDELKAMREEIAKLRERVAVLEAKPAWHPTPLGPSIFEKYRQHYPTSNDRSLQGQAVFVKGSIPPGTITC